MIQVKGAIRIDFISELEREREEERGRERGRKGEREGEREREREREIERENRERESKGKKTNWLKIFGNNWSDVILLQMIASKLLRK